MNRVATEAKVIRCIGGMNEDRIQTNFEVISRRKLNGYIGEEISLKAPNNEYKLEAVIH